MGSALQSTFCEGKENENRLERERGVLSAKIGAKDSFNVCTKSSPTFGWNFWKPFLTRWKLLSMGPMMAGAQKYQGELFRKSVQWCRKWQKILWQMSTRFQNKKSDVAVLMFETWIWIPLFPGDRSRSIYKWVDTDMYKTHARHRTKRNIFM